MAFNHLVLVGGGHSNVLLMKKWLMHPHLIPKCPISIISRDSHLVYSAMFPSVISKEIKLENSLVDIEALANSVKISFIKDEVCRIDFLSRKIFFHKRLSIPYSRLILNCGGETKIPFEYKELLNDEVAFPIKPFFKAYDLLKTEDRFDLEKSLPFVIVGSGLAALEVSFALRKRWKRRKLILVCNRENIDNKFIYHLNLCSIKIASEIKFEYQRIILCTGNQPPKWIKQNILELDNKGRIITSRKINVRNFQEVFAVGDCSSVESKKRNSSGIYAVKVVNTLSKNIYKVFNGQKLDSWFSQKYGLQILNCFNEMRPKAFAIYRNKVFGPYYFFWLLKKNIDNNFINKLTVEQMQVTNILETEQQDDCRGCASKISQQVLNSSLRTSRLSEFAEFPEDASKIFENEQKFLLQSVDGFPALISDPWLNARITTLHACSDLWACGAKVSSAQVIVAIPKIDIEYQDYIFTHILYGVKSTVENLGGKILGGHTYESRNIINRPYPLGVDLSLTVQGIVKKGFGTWKKSGMKEGDSLYMSRPLGVGIFFAAQMRNINLFRSNSFVMENILMSQQFLIDEINDLQDKIGDKLINAATDITGYGLIGHLLEMINTTNLSRKNQNLSPLKVNLNLSSFRAYPGVFDLIKMGIRSSLYESNKINFYEKISRNINKKTITFSQSNSFDSNQYTEIIDLLIDPQTCGPLLISCNSKYEKYLSPTWYKIGEVIN